MPGIKPRALGIRGKHTASLSYIQRFLKPCLTKKQQKLKIQDPRYNCWSSISITRKLFKCQVGRLGQCWWILVKSPRELMLAVTFPDMLAFVGGLAKDLPAGMNESSKKSDKCVSQLPVHDHLCHDLCKVILCEC